MQASPNRRVVSFAGYVFGSSGKSGGDDTSRRCSRGGVTQISGFYSALSALSLRWRTRALGAGVGEGAGINGAADEPSVARMCADNSIDRHCSTDTAYPFQPLRARLIPSDGGVGDLFLKDTVAMVSTVCVRARVCVCVCRWSWVRVLCVRGES